MNKLDFSSLPPKNHKKIGFSNSGIPGAKENYIFFLMLWIIIGMVIIAGTIDHLDTGYLFGFGSPLPFTAIAMLALIPIGFYIYKHISNKEKQFEDGFKNFLESNNFKPSSYLEIKEGSRPFVYGLGSRNELNLEFNGTINTTGFDNFVYTYYVNRKNSEKAYPFTIMHLSLSKTLPHLVLDSRKNDGVVSSIPRYFSDDQRIELEGDFDDYFDLYAPNGYEIEALDIMSPDFMQMLIDFHTDFDVEIDDKSVYIISKGVNYDQQSMSELFTAAQAMVDKFDLKLKPWSMAAMEKQLPELESFTGEKAMRIGSRRVSTALFTIPIIALYIVLNFFGAGAIYSWDWWMYGATIISIIIGLAVLRMIRKKHS